MYINMYVCVYVCVYIYIYRVYIYIVYVYTYTLFCSFSLAQSLKIRIIYACVHTYMQIFINGRWVLYWWSHHCNTLQHTATHCNTPENTANIQALGSLVLTLPLQHSATHCNTLQHMYKSWALNWWHVCSLGLALYCPHICICTHA